MNFVFGQEFHPQYISLHMCEYFTIWEKISIQRNFWIKDIQALSYSSDSLRTDAYLIACLQLIEPLRLDPGHHCGITYVVNIPMSISAYDIILCCWGLCKVRPDSVLKRLAWLTIALFFLLLRAVCLLKPCSSSLFALIQPAGEEQRQATMITSDTCFPRMFFYEASKSLLWITVVGCHCTRDA